LGSNISKDIVEFGPILSVNMTQKIFIEKKNQLEEEGGEFLLVRVCTKRKQERNVN